MAIPPFWRPNACVEYSEEEEQVIAFYKELENETKNIKYRYVPDHLSKKVSEKLTHPTLLREKRWPNVVYAMGTTDQVKIAKFEEYKEFDQPAFYIFLTKHYIPKEDGSLWGLINALLMCRDCIDVLIYVQQDIIDFLEKHRTSLTNDDSNDSGFTSHSTQESYAPVQERDNLELQPLAESLQSIAGSPGINNETCFHFTVPQQEFLPTKSNFLIGASPENYIQKLKAEEATNDAGIPVSKGYPDSFPDTIPNNNSVSSYWHDPITELKKKLFTNPDAVKVFIPHTLEENDVSAAEELAKWLREKYHFETVLFKDLLAELCVDVPHVVLEILDNMDFIVPVLSQAYLEQIRPVGNPDYKPFDCLNLRYLHAVSQGRVINMNSLNYLIRPVMLNDVNYGMVRRCHEFRCAIQYPKDLNRLARNLINTKRMTPCV